MIVTSNITMDLDHRGVMPVVDAVQGDFNSRAVALHLTAGGKDWPIPAGTEVQVRYRKSDNTGGLYDTLPDGTQAWSIGGSTVTVILAPQMLTVAGSVFAQVELNLGDLQLATFTIHLRVEGNALEGAEPSADYFRARFLPQTRGEVGQLLQIAQVDEGGHVVVLETLDKLELAADLLAALPAAEGEVF